MNNKINIGLFNDTFYPMVDGVVEVLNNYAKRLSEFANVYVFVPFIPGQTYDDTKLSYKVIRCKSIKVPFLDYSLPLPKLDKEFKKEIKKYDLDIIHIHSPFTLGAFGINYAKKHNIPVIATMHSQFKQDFKRAVKFDFLANILNKLVVIKKFNKCDLCIAVSNEVARIFYEDYGYKTMPQVLNNATDMLPIKKDNYINKLYNLNKDTKVFLFVGRLNKLKNIFFIAESIKILKDKNPNFKFKMLFVGTGQDKEELKEYIKNNNLEDDIILCGKVIDRDILAKYYKRADLFLFPSKYDASSLVQVEAASQGTPTVFIENTATSNNITNNVNGFITKDSPNDYANKIIEVINNNKLYQEVSKNCFHDLYITWDEVVEKLYKIYQEKINDFK